jgi:hypothetical protein
MHRAVAALATPLFALSVLAATSPSASAATKSAATTAAAPGTIPFNYWVDATTTLKKLNQTVKVPRGTFVGSVNIATSKLTGVITLPPAKAPVKLAGIGLATATFKMTEVKPVTGSIDPSFVVTATGVFNIQIVSVTPVGLASVNLVGNQCTTSTPVSVTMSGPFTAGKFSGIYTIPPLQNCGAATKALNLVVPGPGNTFSAVATPRS